MFLIDSIKTNFHFA